jgi:acyl-CoA synthetase (AMP-forming)/AMP-acid ligase II
VVNGGCSGENIAPVEIDGIMLSHKDVAEAVSFGVPDEMYGQEIHAAVILKPNAQVTEKELQQYIATKVAKFKVPKKVTTVPEFVCWKKVNYGRFILQRKFQRRRRGKCRGPRFRRRSLSLTKQRQNFDCVGVQKDMS